MIRAAVLALILSLMAVMAQAHALQPGYLELRALGEDSWSVFWRRPDVQGQPMQLDAILPEHCTQRSGPAPQFDGEGWSARWITTCPGGLGGGYIEIQGLADTRTDVLVRYELQPGQGQAWRLVPSSPGFDVPADPGTWEVLRSYTVLGVEHILLGPDHLMFVLTLLLLISNLRVLLGAITAFTLSHSVTLGAAALGWLSIPGPPVEAIIALSIMFVASEILNHNPAAPSLSHRAPWLMAFGFGLIHGLGFGSALSEIGLPQNEIVLALLAFNIGVELGQVLFVAVCLLGWQLVRRLGVAEMFGRAQPVAVYAIGTVAAYWLLDRLTGFV